MTEIRWNLLFLSQYLDSRFRNWVCNLMILHNLYKMVKHSWFKTASVTAAAAVFIALPQSCVNEEYDITKIDKTVAFGGEELVFRQTGMSMFQLFLRIFPLVNYRPVTFSGKIFIFLLFFARNLKLEGLSANSSSCSSSIFFSSAHFIWNLDAKLY